MLIKYQYNKGFSNGEYIHLQSDNVKNNTEAQKKIPKIWVSLVD